MKQDRKLYLMESSYNTLTPVLPKNEPEFNPQLYPNTSQFNELKIVAIFCNSPQHAATIPIMRPGAIEGMRDEG